MSSDKSTMLAQLEELRTRLDASLAGLAGKIEHVPMHEVVHSLIGLIADQHAEIQALKQELAALKGQRDQPLHS